jgi:hypothetical protein
VPDPSEELITTLVKIQNGTRQAWASGRLRPLLVGRPHQKRRLWRWSTQQAHHQRRISPLEGRCGALMELAHG